MALSQILQSIQKKGQLRQLPQTASAQPSSQTTTKPQTLPPKERPVDPVVARLKAARKAAMEQKEREMREKKGLKPKLPKPEKRIPARSGPTPARSGPSRANGASRATGARAGSQVAPVVPVAAEKKPKMSFSELMKKASSVDHSKMSIAIKPKSRSPDGRKGRPEKERMRPKTEKASRQPRDRPNANPARPNGRARPNGQARQGNARDVPADQPRAVRAPLPIRRPAAHLEAKLRKNVEEEEGSDSDLGSFIASDEEEEEPVDYDRNEIWSIFNRGRSRTYVEDDYDSDSMEATGAEILAEEASSKRRAELEDRREWEEEQRLAALKRARKQR